MTMKRLLALVLAAMMLTALVPALAEEATPTYGGTLTVLGYQHNTFFLPFSTTTSDRYNAAPAIESLGRHDPETGDTYGWLAEEFVTDAENLTLTIKLRQGIKFSDGSEITAPEESRLPVPGEHSPRAPPVF